MSHLRLGYLHCCCTSSSSSFFGIGSSWSVTRRHRPSPIGTTTSPHVNCCVNLLQNTFTASSAVDICRCRHYEMLANLDLQHAASAYLVFYGGSARSGKIFSCYLPNARSQSVHTTVVCADGASINSFNSLKKNCRINESPWDVCTVC